MITVAVKERTGEMLTANNARWLHRPGDRYVDVETGEMLRLHKPRLPEGQGPQAHFEKEPRWKGK